jgi:hypothetical protein
MNESTVFLKVPERGGQDTSCIPASPHANPNWGCRNMRAGLAAEAAVAIDNVHLAEATQKEISERTRAQEALRELNANLEREIRERTAQLRVKIRDVLDGIPRANVQ